MPALIVNCWMPFYSSETRDLQVCMFWISAHRCLLSCDFAQPGTKRGAHRGKRQTCFYKHLAVTQASEAHPQSTVQLVPKCTNCRSAVNVSAWKWGFFWKVSDSAGMYMCECLLCWWPVCFRCSSEKSSGDGFTLKDSMSFILRPFTFYTDVILAQFA